MSDKKARPGEPPGREQCNFATSSQTHGSAPGRLVVVSRQTAKGVDRYIETVTFCLQLLNDRGCVHAQV
jgi:hypothetical protein